MKSMIDKYPISIVSDLYSGTYSHGLWFAISNSDLSAEDPLESRAEFCLNDGPNGGDREAMNFWSSPPKWITVGNTPNEALDKLLYNA